MAITASGRTDLISSGIISGIGLASANTKGLSAISAIHSFLIVPGPDNPRKISAFRMASSIVTKGVSIAYIALFSSRVPARLVEITPFESQTMMFSFFIPKVMSKLRQAIAAAPAPEQTTRTSLKFLPTTFSPLIIAAPTIIAVPC